MRTLTLLLGALILTLITTQVSAETFSCKIVTGYGTAIATGHTKLEAKAKARELCGSKMIDQYAAQRGSIPDSAVDDLALACVNLDCQ
jgi:hypothetical protein